MSKIPTKKYSVRPRLADEHRANLAPFSDIQAALLYHRGHTNVESAQRFITPNYSRDIHDPFLLKDAEKAAIRIFDAIKKNERVVIYSDYDTDGIPGGVVLHDFFKKIGFTNFYNYIPHRHDEGFGLNNDAVDVFIAEGIKLLITIDCGIADSVPVARAKEGGIDVIITDHHLPGAIIPDAYAIVNPKQEDCTYPEKMLCGSGVVYKLIQAMIGLNTRLAAEKPEAKLFEWKEGYEKWLLDLVGLATMSDMVPLTGENRAFAYYGLTVLRKSPRLGLSALLASAKTNQRYLTEDDVGFTIAPRINAASRMGVPMDAFMLLATTDDAEARRYAMHLDAINNERKGIVASLVKELKKTVAGRFTDRKPAVIVAGNPDWKPSLLGLAANSLAEEYTCPVFLWGRDGDGIIKGSCRSDGVTDLVELMRNALPSPFLQFGGHAFSGGFSVDSGAVHTLQETMEKAYETVLLAREKEEKFQEGQEIGQHETKNKDFLLDYDLGPQDITWETYSQIEILGPFGVGNPKPIFAVRNVIPLSVKTFGKEKNHSELIFEGPYGRPISAIAFFTTPEDWAAERGGEAISPGKPLSVVAHMEKSMFKGRPELRLRIVAIL